LCAPAALGYEDHEGPPRRRRSQRPRISRCLDVPVTVDAEAGYGMESAALVAALRDAGAAGCNLKGTEYWPGIPHDHAAGTLCNPTRHAEWLRSVRQAAKENDHPFVINARLDNFLSPFIAGAEPETQRKLVPEALERASAYLEAGADCVYPIALWEPDALGRFMSDVRGPVNISRVRQVRSVADLAALGVSRVSWALTSSSSRWRTSRTGSARSRNERPLCVHRAWRASNPCGLRTGASDARRAIPATVRA